MKRKISFLFCMVILIFSGAWGIGRQIRDTKTALAQNNNTTACPANALIRRGIASQGENPGKFYCNHDSTTSEFRFIGVNIHALLYLDDAEIINQIGQAQKMGVTVIRVFVPRHDKETTEVINLLNNLFSLAAQVDPNGSIRFVLALTDFHVYTEGNNYIGYVVKGDAAAGEDSFTSGALKPEWFAQRDPGQDYTDSYLPFVQALISTNLSSNPRVFAWELGNEMTVRWGPGCDVNVSDRKNMMLAFAYHVGGIIAAGVDQMVTTGFVSIDDAIGYTLVGCSTPDLSMDVTPSIIQEFYENYSGQPSPFDFGTIHAYDNGWSPFDIDSDGDNDSGYHQNTSTYANEDVKWLFNNGQPKSPYVVEEFGFAGGFLAQSQCDKPANYHFPGGEWWDGNVNNPDDNIPSTENGTLLGRGDAVEFSLGRFFDDFGAAGIMQWGFMAGNSDKGFGDRCRGMDNNSVGWGHTDWQNLHDTYQCRSMNLDHTNRGSTGIDLRAMNIEWRVNGSVPAPNTPIQPGDLVEFTIKVCNASDGDFNSNMEVDLQLLDGSAQVVDTLGNYVAPLNLPSTNWVEITIPAIQLAPNNVPTTIPTNDIKLWADIGESTPYRQGSYRSPFAIQDISALDDFPMSYAYAEVCNRASTFNKSLISQLTVPGFGSCAGNHDLVAVVASYRSNSYRVSSLSYAGVPLTKGCDDHGNEYVTEIWYLPQPPASGSIQVTWGGAVGDIVLGVAALDNVDVSNDPVSAVACNHSGPNWTDPLVGKYPHVDITAAINQVVFGGVTTFTDNWNFNTLSFNGGGVDELWNERGDTTGFNVLSSGGFVSGLLAANITTIGWEGKFPEPWSAAAIAIRVYPVDDTASRFTSGKEGWSSGSNLVHVPDNGNPGGYIAVSTSAQGESPTQGGPYFIAPEKFLGDLTSAYSQTLELDLYLADISYTLETTADIILTGNSITLTLDITPTPGVTWTHYTVFLHESAGWINLATGQPASRQDLLNALSRLDSLQINARYTTEANTVGLDNIVLQKRKLIPFTIYCPLVRK